MAIMKMMAIYDNKANAYPRPPFWMTNRVEALRGFDGACNENDSQFAKFKEDFELHEIGEFDQVTGEIKQEIVKLATASELVKSDTKLKQI